VFCEEWRRKGRAEKKRAKSLDTKSLNKQLLSPPITQRRASSISGPKIISSNHVILCQASSRRIIDIGCRSSRSSRTEAMD
jgi:hypothetical protein